MKKGATAQEKYLLAKVFESNDEFEAAVEGLLKDGKVFTRRAAIGLLFRENQKEEISVDKVTGFYLGTWKIFKGEVTAFYLLTETGVEEIRVADPEKLSFPDHIPFLGFVTVKKATLLHDLQKGVQYYSWGAGEIELLRFNQTKFVNFIQTTDRIGIEADGKGNKTLVRSGYYFFEGAISYVEQLKDWDNAEKDSSGKKEAKAFPIFTKDGVNLRIQLTGGDEDSARPKLKILNRQILKDIYGYDMPEHKHEAFFQYMEEAEPDDQMIELRSALEGKTMFVFASGSRKMKGKELEQPWASIGNVGFVLDEETLSAQVAILINDSPAPQFKSIKERPEKEQEPEEDELPDDVDAEDLKPVEEPPKANGNSGVDFEKLLKESEDEEKRKAKAAAMAAQDEDVPFEDRLVNFVQSAGPEGVTSDMLQKFGIDNGFNGRDLVRIILDLGPGGEKQKLKKHNESTDERIVWTVT